MIRVLVMTAFMALSSIAHAGVCVPTMSQQQAKARYDQTLEQMNQELQARYSEAQANLELEKAQALERKNIAVGNIHGNPDQSAEQLNQAEAQYNAEVTAAIDRYNETVRAAADAFNAQAKIAVDDYNRAVCAR